MTIRYIGARTWQNDPCFPQAWKSDPARLAWATAWACESVGLPLGADLDEPSFLTARVEGSRVDFYVGEEDER